MEERIMRKLTADTLRKLHEEMASFLAPRLKWEFTPGIPEYPYHLLTCGGAGCHASRASDVIVRLQQEIGARRLDEKALIVETGCIGFCACGPLMVIYPGEVFYQHLKPEDVPEIVEEHLIRGYPVERLMYRDPTTNRPLARMRDIPFFSLQQKTVLKNCGLIAAERIEEYIGRQGSQAPARALLEMTPEQIIKEIKDSGLRGRGGAGFPTGLKWEFAARSRGDVKYVLCNADEGDPGAFMDRAVLEGDPHAVLEGMIIAAKAIGAHQGYIYCRAEYPLAMRRLTILPTEEEDVSQESS